MSFSSLPLSHQLLESLPKTFRSPTEVQSLTIPVMLERRDIIALAQTGSGKTLAYGLPILEHINVESQTLQAIIIVPTRELAAQVSSVLSELASKVGGHLTCLTGGVDKEAQITQLKHQPQLIVATPGRLLDLINGRSLETEHIATLVLDEADRLLDLGFWQDIQTISNKLPTKRQTAMFSATFSPQLEDKVNALVTNPHRIHVNRQNSVSTQIEEVLYLVNKGSKTQALIHQIKAHQWKQVLVFISAKDNADALSKKLNKAGLPTKALHGNKDQSERASTLNDFKHHKIQVLIATDLLARGIDIEHLPVVINYDLPSHAETYVHRVGRTARAGKKGVALSFVCHAEMDYLNAIQTLTQRTLPLNALDDFPVTDKPSSGESKRAPKDKKANRRTNAKKSIKQFKSKPKR